LVAIEIFRFRAQLSCPRCASSNIDKRFMHMGELSCKHCHYFWRVE